MNPIVMPYFNAPDWTAQAIDDCLAQSLSPSPLLLIDNGSQAAGKEVGVQAAYAHADRVLRWWHDPPLPSLAAVWNRALRFCWEAGAEHAMVVNNDVRLHPHTYEVLLEALHATDAWFVSAVSVRDGQFDSTIDLRAAIGTLTEARKDGIRPEGYSYGGPDFSCFVMRKECHRWFQFDEGFQPAYHEDNDFHRRLQLAGFSHKIFGVNVPFLHYGSGTLKTNARLQESWGPKFAACQDYYRQKWGGLPGNETFQRPFDSKAGQGVVSDLRMMHAGQGKPPWREFAGLPGSLG